MVDEMRERDRQKMVSQNDTVVAYEREDIYNKREDIVPFVATGGNADTLKFESRYFFWI